MRVCLHSLLSDGDLQIKKREFVVLKTLQIRGAALRSTLFYPLLCDSPACGTTDIHAGETPIYTK